MAALNDCLNRFRCTSKYIVFTDLDEHIIPRNAGNWSDLISQNSLTPYSRSAFKFLNTIFRRQWPSPAKGFQAVAEKYKSHVLGFTQREEYIFPKSVRCKTIVNPKVTEEMGIHFPWRMRGRIFTVPEGQGLLHHYRKALSQKTCPRRKCITPVVDLHAVNILGDQLAAQLERVWSRIPPEFRGDREMVKKMNSTR